MEYLVGVVRAATIALAASRSGLDRGRALYPAVLIHVIDDAGVAGWWPGLCWAFDATAGTCLAAVLLRTAGRNVP